MAQTSKRRKGWKLVWADEFDGKSVDRTKWDFDIGNGFYDYKNHAWVPGWGNEELQYYTHEPENVVVRDSCLVIRAVRAPLHGCGYTSARLKTKARDGTVLFSKLYGRIEYGKRRQGQDAEQRRGCTVATPTNFNRSDAAQPAMDRLIRYSQMLVEHGVMLNCNVGFAFTKRGTVVTVYLQGDQVVKMGRYEKKKGNIRLDHPETGEHLEGTPTVGDSAMRAIEEAASSLAATLGEIFDLEPSP